MDYSSSKLQLIDLIFIALSVIAPLNLCSKMTPHISQQPSPMNSIVVDFLQSFHGSVIHLVTLKSGESYYNEVTQLVKPYNGDVLSPVVLSMYTLSELMKMSATQGRSALSSRESRLFPSVRFSAAQVLIFPEGISRFLGKTTGFIGNLCEIIYKRQIFLNYYIIFAPSFAKNDQRFGEDLRFFKNLATSSPFIFVWDWTDVQVLCVHCPYSNDVGGPVFFYPRGSTKSEIDFLHERLHGNLRKAVVHVMDMKGRTKPCSKLEDGTGESLSPSVCLSYEALKSLNGTPKYTSVVSQPNKWDTRYISRIMGAVILPEQAAMLKNKRNRIPFEWVLGNEIH